MNNKNQFDPFTNEVGKKANRLIKARDNPTSVWFGLGMMGLIGWAVMVPTLLGAALGSWLDKKYPGIHSWTLSLLIIGLCIGCLNAWHWISKQHRDIQQEQENNDE